jgi:predicted nucleic acid-binding protein
LTKNAGLKDADAKHVMYAVANACDYFVTLDTRDLLPARSAIQSICPQLKIMTPAEAVAAIRPA